MNWETEWNDILAAENIVVRCRHLADRQQELAYLHYQKKRMFGKLGQVFYKLWEAHELENDQCDWADLQRDLYLAHRIIQKGSKWKLADWELLDVRIQEKEPFHTVWGDSFYQLFKHKLKAEKKLARRRPGLLQKKKRDKIRKQKQRGRHREEGVGTAFLAGVLGLVSLAFLSVWLYDTIRSDQSRYRLQAEKAVMELTQKKSSGQRGMAVQAPAVTVRTVTASSVTGASLFSRDEQKKKPEILEKYKAFYKQHPTLYGWLRIDGTKIDLPVMRPSGDMEADYYLDHTYDGQEDIGGTLFVDPECRLWERSQNIVIYGHNMRNKEMFGDLMSYESPDFSKEHKKLNLDTIYEEGVYEVIAVVLTRVLNQNEEGFRYYQLFDFHKAQDYQECQDFINKNLAYGEPVELVEGQDLLMLSTCEYSQANGRLLVVAKRLD